MDQPQPYKRAIELTNGFEQCIKLANGLADCLCPEIAELHGRRKRNEKAKFDGRRQQSQSCSFRVLQMLASDTVSSRRSRLTSNKDSSIDSSPTGMSEEDTDVPMSERAPCCRRL